ncbi:MAG: endonuclease/exonuclease/phosphatase family protein [Marmoricola sp.]
MMSRIGHRFGAQVVVGVVALALAPGGIPTAAAQGPGAASAGDSVSTTTAARTARGHHYLHVASFNISGVLNDRNGRSHRPWQVRGTRVARQLLGQDPAGQRGARADVIALQEANTSRRLSRGRTQYTDLVGRLNRWVTGGNPYRSINPSLRLNATRIAYNSHTLRLQRAGAFRWSAQETRIDGERMMAWAWFRVRATGRRFFFASVHLESASKALRLRQWQQLVKVVPKLAHGLPVVIGGDFNATRNQHDAARQMLPRMRRAGFGDTLGQNGPGYLTFAHCRARHLVDANFFSVNHYGRHLAHYGHHNWVGQDIDYLFASNRLKVTSWELVADHRRGRDTIRGVIPSDHNMVRATIAFG